MKIKYVFGVFVLGLCLPVWGQEVPKEIPLSTEVLVEENADVFDKPYDWEDFLIGKSCEDDFVQFQKMPFLTQSQEQLKGKFQRYCMGKITIWDTFLHTFYQNKKALLIDDCLQKNGPFLGYIKAIPYFLFDIHARYPQGKSLGAQLDEIQNAIQNKDPEQVVGLMQNLLPEQQLFLMPIFNMAMDLIDFKNLLKEAV